MIIKRIFLDIFLLGAIFYAPWWLVVVIAIFGVFYFHSYYEVLFAGMLMDILYSASSGGFSFWGACGFLTSVVLFVVIERIKCELR